MELVEIEEPLTELSLVGEQTPGPREDARLKPTPRPKLSTPRKRSGDIFPPIRQRKALLLLAKNLGSRDRALRRDECGDWRIEGRKGHIYAVPRDNDAKQFSYLIIFSGGSASSRVWNHAKRMLGGFARLTLDGDFEGAFLLDQRPSFEQAAAIRKELGIPKRRVLSDRHLGALMAAGERHRFNA